MKENIFSIAATAALALINLRDEVTAWVGLICTLAVTVVTCAVNIYRLWRDRDKDKHKCNDNDEIKNDKGQDNG